MKRSRSMGFMTIAIGWIIVSLYWFFMAGNDIIGAIFLCMGVVELGIAVAVQKKDSKKDK